MFYRPQTPLEYPVWTKQCDYFPWCRMAKAMVLVVMACSSSWLLLA